MADTKVASYETWVAEVWVVRKFQNVVFNAPTGLNVSAETQLCLKKRTLHGIRFPMEFLESAYMSRELSFLLCSTNMTWTSSDTEGEGKTSKCTYKGC